MSLTPLMENIAPKTSGLKEEQKYKEKSVSRNPDPTASCAGVYSVMRQFSVVFHQFCRKDNRDSDSSEAHLRTR